MNKRNDQDIKAIRSCKIKQRQCTTRIISVPKVHSEQMKKKMEYKNKTIFMK